MGVRSVLVAGSLLVAACGLTVAGPGEPSRPTKLPVPEPTTVAQKYRTPDFLKLIVQQNPDCWTGIPGYTCPPTERLK